MSKSDEFFVSTSIFNQLLSCEDKRFSPSRCTFWDPESGTSPQRGGLGQYGPPERVPKGSIGVPADLDDPWLFKVLRPSLQDGYWMYTAPTGWPDRALYGQPLLTKHCPDIDKAYRYKWLAGSSISDARTM